MSEEDMQKDFKAFREGRSQRYAVELFGVPSFISATIFSNWPGQAIKK